MSALTPAQAYAALRRHHFAHIHPSITTERVTAAVERQLATLRFCVACGAEAEEPDAEQHECESCGEPAVFGAEVILITLA